MPSPCRAIARNAAVQFAVIIGLALCSPLLITGCRHEPPGQSFPEDSIVETQPGEVEAELEAMLSPSFKAHGYAGVIDAGKHSVGDVPSARYCKAKVVIDDDLAEAFAGKDADELRDAMFGADAAGVNVTGAYDPATRSVPVTWNSKSKRMFGK